MQYFDIVRNDVVDQEMAKRLGYKRILAIGKDLDLLQNLGGTPKREAVVISKDPGTLIRATRENRIVGIMFEGNEIVAKAMMAAKDNEKTVILSIEGLNGGGTGLRLSTIYKLRKMLAELTKARVKVAIVTMADRKEMLLSSAQMVQVAKFLGANDQQARQMVSALGE